MDNVMDLEKMHRTVMTRGWVFSQTQMDSFGIEKVYNSVSEMTPEEFDQSSSRRGNMAMGILSRGKYAIEEGAFVIDNDRDKSVMTHSVIIFLNQVCVNVFLTRFKKFYKHTETMLPLMN